MRPRHFFFGLLLCRWLGLGPVLAIDPASAAAAATSTPPVPAALRIAGPLSPRNASYRLTAKLDEDQHRVSGEGTLTWRNLERQPTNQLVFHLYQNAFKNFASTFIREAGPQLRGDQMPEHGFGAIDVTRLSVNGRDLLGRATLDDTLLTVQLDSAIGPSASVEVQLAWSVQLPQVFARSGWHDRFHAVTQWFPKIGVFECSDRPPTACRWRAHQYHGFTEFFADYGVYDVTLDVPAATVVGATGVLTSETIQGDRRRLTYHAEDVHDFAWFADPRFIELHDRIDDEFGSVAVRLLTRRGQEPQAPRHFTALRAALLEAERQLGSYPYSNITIVIPPAAASGAAGMEYPTLFASMASPSTTATGELEDTTAHEFLHQFFYGIIGSDEVENAWLDEGMTETFTGWVMDRLKGERCSVINLPSLCLSASELDWLSYRGTTRQLPITTLSYTLPHHLWNALIYSHPAVMMRTLQQYLGAERMTAGLRRYAERARFRHPRPADFVAAISDGAQEDLSWFFSQALDSTRTADYAILAVETDPHQPAAGLWDCPPQPRPLPSDLSDSADQKAWQQLVDESQQLACAGKPPGRHELAPSPASHTALHDSEVTVQRRGDFFFPVDIVAAFADGSAERTTWSLAEQQADPQRRIKVLRYPRRKSPLVRAEVDPEQRLVLDENRLNNSRTLAPQRRPVLRIWLSVVGALQTLLDLVGV